MLKRTKYFIGGLLVALTVGAIAQTGGLPSRPRFLSVGVGTAAPSTNGNMNVAGSVTASNFVGNVGGVAPSDFARLSQTNTFQDRLRIESVSRHIDVFPTGEPGGWVPLSIRDASGADQWWLIANSLNGDLTIQRESGAGTFRVNGGSIDLQATSVRVNGSEVCRADGINCPPQTPVVVVVNRTDTTQTLFSGSTDPVIWNNDVHDPNNLHDPVTNPDRIFLPQGTGYAQCQATVTFWRGTGFSASTNYEIGIYINLNGNTLSGSWGMQKNFWSSNSTNGGFHTVNVISAVIPTTNPSDYIQVRTVDNWGNSPTGPIIQTDGGSSATSTRASCWAVGR